MGQSKPGSPAMHHRSLVETTELVLDILNQDPVGIARRQATVNLTEDDVAALRGVHSALAAAWPGVLDGVVRQAVLQPELKSALEAPGAAAALRAELQAHVSELTSGDYAEAFMADRVRAALRLCDAGLPADWIASGWSVALTSLLPALRDATRGAPEGFLAAVSALMKVAFLDLAMMLHANAHLEREALAGLRQFAATVLESVPDGVVLTDSAGRIVRFNAAAERIFGIDRQTASTLTLGELLHEANRGEEETRRRGVLAQPNEPGRSARPGPSAAQMTGLRADGRTVPIEVTFQSGALDGEPVCCASIRDVTERVTAELALRRSEVNFRALIEGSPDAVLVHRAGAVIYANPGLLALIGRPDLRSVIGLPVVELLAAADRRALFPAADDPVARAARVESAHRPREVRFLRGDSEVWTETREFALDFDGQPAIVMIARDVTERHALAERVYKMDRAIAIGSMAAATGHEINNPLTYVLGNTHFARRELRKVEGALRAGASGGELADKLSEVLTALDEVQEGALRVRAAVASLQAMARDDTPVSATCRLEAVIDHAVSIASNEVRHRARLERQYMAVPSIVGCETRLTQLFVHLLVNAAHAIPEGDTETNEIRITMYSDGDRVCVDLMDSGCGMEAQVLARAFEPFFTTHPANRAAGLGLNICRQIAESAGGTLSLISEPGMGTTARVVFPAADPEAPRDRITGPFEPFARSGRILLIDDEPFVTSTFRRVVEDHHSITSFTSARDALRRLESGETWDVIFCDLHMPDLSGMQFYEAVVKARPDLASRIVYLTGGAFTPEAQEFLRTVDNPWLDKPFDANRIARILARFLSLAAPPSAEA